MCFSPNFPILTTRLNPFRGTVPLPNPTSPPISYSYLLILGVWLSISRPDVLTTDNHPSVLPGICKMIAPQIPCSLVGMESLTSMLVESTKLLHYRFSVHGVEAGCFTPHKFVSWGGDRTSYFLVRNLWNGCHKDVLFKCITSQDLLYDVLLSSVHFLNWFVFGLAF